MFTRVRPERQSALAQPYTALRFRQPASDQGRGRSYALDNGDAVGTLQIGGEFCHASAAQSRAFCNDLTNENLKFSQRHLFQVLAPEY
ncbi:hypothetical protein QE369_000627 [Agrobacterium larrymoorei]|uniref:Uncharacterized protein n=1 Tax=Agrobacterium larrymoorei TaxID=160699 RepID=A0AAJ2EQB8_9HYPH|nr:hypothetical protein [Agrobacterium larrymoorei]